MQTCKISLEEQLVASPRCYTLIYADPAVVHRRPPCPRYGPAVPDGYGMGYIISNEAIRTPVTAFREGGETDGALMAEGVMRALRDIGDIYR